jgi:DnaJ like chaperone protein
VNKKSSNWILTLLAILALASAKQNLDAASQPQERPVLIFSRAEYDQLPVGTLYDWQGKFITRKTDWAENKREQAAAEKKAEKAALPPHTNAPRATLVATPTPSPPVAAPVPEINSWNEYDALAPQSLYRPNGLLYRKPRNRTANEIAKTAISSPTPVSTITPTISNRSDQQARESTVSPVPTVVATPATVSNPPQIAPDGPTVIAWLVILPILAGLAYLTYRTSSFHPANAGTQENPPNTESGQQKSFVIYHDLEQFRLAYELWSKNREIFAIRDGERLAALETKLKQDRPISGWGCLGFIIGAIAIGSAHGAGAGWGIIILGIFVVGLIGCVEEKVQRWRYRDQLIKKLFTEPEPIFQERRYQEPPPRQESPPPKQNAPPPQQQEPPPKTREVRINSLRQAFEILGLPPGKITLSAARVAYKTRMLEYHPDRVQHLGPELRELAGRKALEINLAWDYIQKHCRS